jgi:hypothetical protein
VCSYTRRIHRLEATDPRDTVYALLGLSSGAEERGIYPDYTKPCWQVFAEVSRIYMKLEDGPRFLSLCYFPKQQPDLPSRVPDWSAVSKNRERPIGFEWGPDKLIGGNVRLPFAASRELPYDREVQTDDLSLFRLKGAIIDTIKAALGEDIKRKFESQWDKPLSSHRTNWTRSSAFYKASEDSSLHLRLGGRPENSDQSLKEQALIEPMVIGQTQEPQASTKYVALRTFNIHQTLERLDIVHKLGAAVRNLTALGGAVYQSRSSKEGAVWRTLVADQQADSKDIWHRPAARHYHLYTTK